MKYRFYHYYEGPYITCFVAKFKPLPQKDLVTFV